MADLPKSLRIRGGAFTSKTTGNGVRPLAEGVRGLLGSETIFAVDHSRSIEKTAGVATYPTVTMSRRNVQKRKPAYYGKEESKVPADGWETVSVEDATLSFDAKLSDKYPGYDVVAKNIMALRADGRHPEVSVWFSHAGIDYDPATDELFFKTPYKLNHIGSVDVAAQAPEHGVGVFDVTLSSVTGTSGSAPQDDFLASAHFEADVSPDQCAAFAEQWLGTRPDLVERLGKSLGQDVAPPAPAAKPEAPESSYQPPTLPESASGGKPDAKAELHMPDSPTTPPASPAAAPTAATLSKDDVEKLVEARLSGMNTEIVALKAKAAASDAAALAQARSRVAAELSCEAKDLEFLSTVAACDDYLTKVKTHATKLSAENASGILPRGGQRPKPNAEHDAHLKSLEDGRTAFLSSIAIREA